MIVWAILSLPRQTTADSNWPSGVHGIAHPATIRCLLVESWMNFACDETRPGGITKTCSQAVSAHAVEFEIWILVGFIGNGEPTPPTPVYAPGIAHCTTSWKSAEKGRNFQIWRDTYWSRIRRAAILTWILTASRNHCPKKWSSTGSAQHFWFPGKAKMANTLQHFLHLP